MWAVADFVDLAGYSEPGLSRHPDALFGDAYAGVAFSRYPTSRTYRQRLKPSAELLSVPVLALVESAKAAKAGSALSVEVDVNGPADRF